MTAQFYFTSPDLSIWELKKLKRNSKYDTTRQVVGTGEAKWTSKLPNKGNMLGKLKLISL